MQFVIAGRTVQRGISIGAVAHITTDGGRLSGLGVRVGVFVGTGFVWLEILYRGNTGIETIARRHFARFRIEQYPLVNGSKHHFHWLHL